MTNAGKVRWMVDIEAHLLVGMLVHSMADMVMHSTADMAMRMLADMAVRSIAYTNQLAEVHTNFDADNMMRIAMVVANKRLFAAECSRSMGSRVV